MPEIALILRLPQQKVRRWLKDYFNSNLSKSHNQKYSWVSNDHQMVNFLTMIEFYVFYKMREHHISAAKILKAHDYLAKTLNTAHPFASRQVLINGRDVLYNPDEEIWINADKTEQIVIYEILKEFSVKIEFSDTKIAERFWPLGRDRAVVVDPHHKFGQPVLKGTNINTATIYAMYSSGEQIATISELYDISPKEIQDAIAFSKQTAA
jgi:uncharacterized protein (DUF433 family)